MCVCVFVFYMLSIDLRLPINKRLQHTDIVYKINIINADRRAERTLLIGADSAIRELTRKWCGVYVI